MTSTVVLDFETRSAADIKAVGAHAYAAHWSTAALCLAYALDSEPVALWVPRTSPFFRPKDHGAGVMPPRLRAHIERGGRVVAHNAHFELVIWAMCRERFPDDWPELRPEQVSCTMVRGRALSLPGALEFMALALNLPLAKDTDGGKAMKTLMKPHKKRGELVWVEGPAIFDRMCDYAKQDVEVERALDRALPELSPSERELWLADFYINRRGVPLDVETVKLAATVRDEEARALSYEVAQITGGISATQREAFRQWVCNQGLEADNLQAATVDKLIAKAERRPDLTHVAQALKLRQQSSLSSLGKLDAMLERAMADNRARGLLKMNGADTGRHAGQGIQTQNMTRPGPGFKLAHSEVLFAMLRQPNARRLIRREFGSVMDPLSYSLRPLIRATPGSRFLCCDYSNIEGRVLAWLAGEQWKLDAFADFDAGHGADLYRVAYGRAFGIDPADVDDDQRQIGKVMELALGYQGGHNAFITMGAGYGVNLEEIAEAVRDAADPEQWDRYAAEYRRAYDRKPKSVPLADEARARAEAQIGAKIRSLGLSEPVYCAVKVIYMNWRNAHPNVRAFWRELEDAAVSAVASPGEAFSAGEHITFRVDGDFLMCRLPSGRCLAYGRPELVREEDLYGRPKSGLRVYGTVGKNYVRWHPYGGLIAENVTQAASRDVLMEAVKRLERRNYPVVMHVHDEALCELPDGRGSLEEMREIMCDTPPWLRGCPIAASGWTGVRYRK